MNIYKSKTKLGEAVQLKFDLAQHSRDSKLLTRLQNWLGLGSVNKHSQNAVMFTTTKFSDFTEYLIPFFDKYQIIGVKFEDYQDLKKVAQLMEKKAHLTIEGLEEIRIIKAKMNRGRSQHYEVLRGGLFYEVDASYLNDKSDRLAIYINRFIWIK